MTDVDYDALADQILANPRAGVRRATAKAVDHDPPYVREGDPPSDPAEAFALGVEAGREDVAQCCGCNNSAEGVTSPYDGSVL